MNRKDLDVESGQDNWAHVFDKCDLEKQKYSYKLEDLYEMIQSNKKLKVVEENQKSFRIQKKKLGLDPNKITCDEQDIINALQGAFEGCLLNTMLKTKDLILTFLNTSLEQKWMNLIIKAEILLGTKQTINDRESWNYCYQN